MIEQEAIRAIGMETAGYMNLGKSRNDQVATALRMETRSRLLDLAEALCDVEDSLVALGRKYGRAAMPGYTHLQHAQPVTVAHHLQSYFDAIRRDLVRISQAYDRVNLSPMGSAALAGTSIRVDRDGVASLLGFGGIIENAMDAVSSRDFALESVSVACMAMVNLSRIAEELILWSSSEFAFVEISDEYSATSSIMPQKKNPVVAETIRARCGSVIGRLTAVLAITKAMPNSYNLDLQEVTPHLWAAMSDTVESAGVMASMLSTLKFREEKMRASLSEDKSTATELANHLVRGHGLPFRQAHAIAGRLVRDSLERGITLEEAAYVGLPVVSKEVTGRSVKIDKDQLKSVLDALKTLEMITSAGGANPLSVPRQLVKDARLLRDSRAWVNQARGSLRRSGERLQDDVRKTISEVRR
jgi:argininosuccinate lyase